MVEPDIQQKNGWAREGALLCFFVSGMSGLIYEVVWTRMLGLVFGNTVFATSTVLTAYMAGLALGSYLSGRYADGIKRTLRAYAFLEIGIGVFCLLLPVLINLLGKIYFPIQRSLNLSFYSFSLVRFVLCFLLLLIPTMLMGATLPVFSRFYVRHDDRLGHGIGRIYATNTFGAFLGTVLSGFLMIAYLGMRNTINVAVAGNIVAGLICLLIDYKRLTPAPMKKKESKKDERSASVLPASTASQRAVLITLMIGFGVSGFTAMVYEVAWTRILVMIIGSTVYAFSIMLATFLLGIAIGSLLFSIIAKRVSVNLLWFAVAEVIIGLMALLMLPVFEWMPLYFVNLFDRIVHSVAVLELIKFLVCSITMIIPTVLMGSLFPMVTHICARDYSELGHKVGTVYSVNTLGNISGSFMVGFVLIPNVGIQKSITFFAAALNIAVGCMIFLVNQTVKLRYRVFAFLASAVVGVICILAIPPWDKMIISSGASAYAPMYAGFRDDERKLNIAGAGEKLLYYKEGTNATITVKERESGTVAMAVDGKVDASNTGDMCTQLMLGHIPLLLSSDPKTALIIGLGSGVTLSAAAQYPLTRIDCVEIEPVVVEASKFFSNVNRDVLKDPRVNLIINDGRNHLAGSLHKYDVIISEPSNLWLAGIANLFSSDFYRICKKRLNPGGIICQWSHIYYMSKEDLKVVVSTFRSVFPHTSIWFSTVGDIMMIGSSEELIIDYLELARRYNIPGVREDLQRLNIREPLALLSCYLLDEDGVAKFTTGSRINSDNHPILEFSVPRSIYVNSSISNRGLLIGFKTREFPDMKNFASQRVTGRASFWYHLGVAYDYKDMPKEARKHYEKAISVDAGFAPAYVGLALNIYKEGRSQDAIENLKKAIELDPLEADAYYNLAQIYEDQGLLDEAISNYKSAVRLSPNTSKYQKKLADLLSKE